VERWNWRGLNKELFGFGTPSGADEIADFHRLLSAEALP
jgi:hypothetical protein